MSEVEVLRQGLWDAWAALGHDTDGDTGPGALIAGMGVEGFVNMVVSDATRFRRESEEDYDADVTRLEQEVERWMEKAREAGEAYGNANSKHHAELDRANRLEHLADTLSGRAVELEDRARAAEAEVERLVGVINSQREEWTVRHSQGTHPGPFTEERAREWLADSIERDAHRKLEARGKSALLRRWVTDWEVVQ